RHNREKALGAGGDRVPGYDAPRPQRVRAARASRIAGCRRDARRPAARAGGPRAVRDLHLDVPALVPSAPLGGGGARRRRRARREPLRPGLAVEALLAAMQARFELSDDSVERLLGPALADWRDAVGCADPILVPANAQGEAAERALVPVPMPSWCTWLVDSGALRLDGPPAIQGPRVVQPAWLVVIREVELSAVECFPIVFAARFGSGAASLHVHLALSPPFLSQEWRGSVCLRAAAQRVDRAHPPVRLWLGAPASPAATDPAAGRSGETVVTWAVDPVPAPSVSAESAEWPTGWPRWAVLRALEGREPQAVWDLTALWRARLGTVPEASSGGPDSGAPGSMRLAVDIESTSTVVVEEDGAACGSVGGKL